MRALVFVKLRILGIFRKLQCSNGLAKETLVGLTNFGQSDKFLTGDLAGWAMHKVQGTPYPMTAQPVAALLPFWAHRLPLFTAVHRAVPGGELEVVVGASRGVKHVSKYCKSGHNAGPRPFSRRVNVMGAIGPAAARVQAR